MEGLTNLVTKSIDFYPSRHTTLFERSSNIFWTLWTLDRRWNNVVCQLGYKECEDIFPSNNFDSSLISPFSFPAIVFGSTSKTFVVENSFFKLQFLQSTFSFEPPQSLKACLPGCRAKFQINRTFEYPGKLMVVFNKQRNPKN